MPRIAKHHEHAIREEAEILALEARVDDLQLAQRAAAAKYAEAAGLVAPFDTEQQRGFLLAQAGELYKQRHEFGDDAALTEAIGVYRGSLELLSHFPQQECQNYLQAAGYQPI